MSSLVSRTVCLVAAVSLVASIGLARPEPTYALELNIQAPDPQIPIPGLSKFVVPTPQPCPSSVTTVPGQECLDIPWLGQYLRGLYQYGVILSSILAVIVIMVAGFIWMTAGGSSGRVSTARSYIFGAMSGLALMLGSYMILYLVNPELVVFKSLVLEIPKTISLQQQAQAIYDSGGAIGGCVDKDTGQTITALKDTTLPPSIQQDVNNAAQTYGISPGLLAGILGKETGGKFNGDGISSTGAAGIGQILPGTASDIWDRYTEGHVTRPPECANVNKQNRYSDSCLTWMKNNQAAVIFMSASYLKNYIIKNLSRCGYGDNLSIIAAGYHDGPGKTDGDLCKGMMPSADKGNSAESIAYPGGVKAYYDKLCLASNGKLEEPPAIPPAE